ncbi:class I SAM-dependent methyltransferase [Limibaculum sp. M0105]|uniref:Class I SAM-dependent methyltransferase n=1 Tax=Thermohalobaculum xanthum TaxID=2753746 RepID=A0A8J7SEE4_9RHOB|nr:class I SAM-dependent methyltransferase [Thermohalobaculum xanthum]MBK0398907.1 class I SAM-dependent methyltransferase [Thermohalobaculum xanthum]
MTEQGIRTTCRFCGAGLELSLIDLGRQPLANSYLPDDPAAVAAEQRFPLHARVCQSCWLVQLDHDAPAENIFAHDYAYLSSYSDSWVAHAGRYAEAMIARFGLGPASRVIEVASNDGYLLRHFVEAGIPVLGVEPAGHAAEVARGRGVDTRVAFFNAETAAGLAAEGIRADLIAANNVLAHVPDIRGFVAGFPLVLAPEGVVTFEFPHLLNMIERVQFDTIYHEHYSYLSLLAVEAVLASAGLRVFDVGELPTHGGSLRVFACHQAAAHPEAPGLAVVRAREAAAGLGSPAPYAGFAARAEALRAGFMRYLAEARAAGATVAAYGAAAKGNTFLNYCGVGRAEIRAVADRNPQKQGRLLPGSHIPIVSPEALIGMKPERVVILPWNLKDEIAAQLASLRAGGSRFAVIDASAGGGVAEF